MKDHVMTLRVIVTSFLMILLSSLCMAGEQETQIDSFSLIQSESEGISDGGLLLIRGLGNNGVPIVIPGSLSVILWDEIGSSNGKTSQEKSVGSNNSQNLNLMLINANGTR